MSEESSIHRVGRTGWRVIGGAVAVFVSIGILAYGLKFLRDATLEAHTPQSAELVAVGDLD